MATAHPALPFLRRNYRRACERARRIPAPVFLDGRANLRCALSAAARGETTYTDITGCSWDFRSGLLLSGTPSPRSAGSFEAL